MKAVAVFSLAYKPLIGGAEIAVEEIAARLPERRFVVFTMRFEAAHLAVERHGNVEVVRVGPTWLPLQLRKVAYPLLAARAAARRAGEFGLAWGIMAAHAGLAASWLKRRHPELPFLLTLQEGKTHGELERGFRLVPHMRAIFRRADAIQCISSYLAAFARRAAPAARIEIVPNGVDVGRFAAASEIPRGDGFTVVTASRLVPKNGIDTLVEAVRLLPDVSLAIFGDGPDRAALERRAAGIGRVTFAGSVAPAALPARLAAGHCFARLSRAEGFGNAFVEAMAAGLPVVATPVGGIPDFARDGENALLVPPESPEAAAGAIARLRDDAALRERLAAAGRETAARYDWRDVARRMDDIFLSLEPRA